MDQETKKKRYIEKLCQIYKRSQIGLFLGAGVSVQSGVPSYIKMALDLYRYAVADGMLSDDVSPGALEFLRQQAELACEREDALKKDEIQKADDLRGKLVVGPEEVATFVSNHLADNRRQDFEKLVKRILYNGDLNRVLSHKMLHKNTWEKNGTLHAVICFCAALLGSALAPKSFTITSNSLKKLESEGIPDDVLAKLQEIKNAEIVREEVFEHVIRTIIGEEQTITYWPLILKHSRKPRIEPNPKVGGILTTNYDNLVEGSFGSKFGRSLLIPVARASAPKNFQGRRVIPVYHIHGYVSYVSPKGNPEGVKGSKLVMTEDSYFETFYDPLGFSNYTAMSFLQRLPCLFIGSAMEDSNIRRFLYHLRRERVASTKHPIHFAILRNTNELKDDVVDAILSSYGVNIIRIDKYTEIRDILAEVYSSVGGVTKKDWEKLWGFKWRSKGRG